jgi:metal-dependent HD superfamily phosphatase/phosphodiesterase
MHNYAGIFQVDELLRPKLLHSSIAPYVEVSASISGEPGKDLGVVYSL